MLIFTEAFYITIMLSGLLVLSVEVYNLSRVKE